MDEEKVDESQHCKRCNRNLPKDDFFRKRKHWAQCNTCIVKKQRSVRNHNGKFECPYDSCNWTSGGTGSLPRHIKQFHDKIKDHECEHCDYKCSTGSALRQHIKQVHDKIKDHECEHCDYKCSTRSALRQHIKQVHDKIKDHVCPTCPLKCSSRCNLRAHIRVCTGELRMSSGEYQVMKALDAMAIDYIHDSIYELQSDKGWLRWDFRIEHDGNQLMIEYDGEAHFKPSRFGNMT